MRMRNWAAMVIALTLLSSAAVAQVYRCEMNGKISYSDEPCMGAKRVDVRPTRGLDKLSGKSSKGAEVRAEEWNKQAADIFRPVFRETPDQRATRHRRYRNNLTPEETAECYLLDARMGRAEEQERAAKGVDLKQVQQQLLMQRQRHKKLKC